MSKTLEGRIALVTGATRGMGRAIADTFAAEGAHVVITSRNADDVQRVAQEINDAGGQATGICANAASTEEMEKAFQTAEGLPGTFDVLVNNAGIGILGPIESMSDSDIDDQIAINIRSVYIGCRRMVPQLDKVGGGNIINIASISGLIGMGGASIYSSSKFAAVGFSRALDKELSPRNIKVTAICPAGVETTWAFGTGIDPDAVADADRIAPQTIADAVLFAVNQPANTRVSELVVYPMSENSYQ